MAEALTAMQDVLISPLAYSNGRLVMDGVVLEDLAVQYGTPLYVYSAKSILERFAAYRSGAASRKHLICYAVKANSNLSVLRLLAEQGAGADIVSGGELYRVLKAGFPADRIVYSGVGKSPHEIEEALAAGILLFSVESVAELHALSAIASRAGRTVRLSLRINPDVDPATHPYISTGLKESKFGIPHGEALAAFRLARELPGLEPIGIGFHIGSQLLGLSGFRDAARVLRRLVEALRAEGLHLEHLDVGGGLGIAYGGEAPPDPADYVRLLAEELPFPEATLVFEPGRSLVGAAGALLTRTLYVKENEGKRFIIVDAGMNDLIRPTLYEAYHSIWPAREALLADRQRADLVGPVCESGDFFAKDRDLPRAGAGDLLCLASAGAYGFVMASNYNSRPRPAEVLVESPPDGPPQARLIRRRESYADLVRGELADEL